MSLPHDPVTYPYTGAANELSNRDNTRDDSEVAPSIPCASHTAPVPADAAHGLKAPNATVAPVQADDEGLWPLEASEYYRAQDAKRKLSAAGPSSASPAKRPRVAESEVMVGELRRLGEILARAVGRIGDEIRDSRAVHAEMLYLLRQEQHRSTIATHRIAEALELVLCTLEEDASDPGLPPPAVYY